LCNGPPCAPSRWASPACSKPSQPRPLRLPDSHPIHRRIGKRTAIVALVLYALLPILRNTYVGLTGIDPAVLESAEAMGMTRSQILFRVRFPLALAVILAGIRTATIITIGVATIAAAIGAGGLGTFIFRGVALVSDALILAGAIPAALLALLADFLLAASSVA